MINNPLVSVIIPFLNPGVWLSEAIDSILFQTYTNWEIILIDDGSVEADTISAMSYVNAHPEKIVYCMHDQHLNKGLPASRNLGIRKSKGSFIAFLDADDRWMPLKIERQLNLFAAMPTVQMICEASLFWYSWSDNQKKDFVQNIGTAAGMYDPPQLVTLLYPFGLGNPPCPSGIMIRREAILRRGGFEEAFEGMYHLYEDQAFLFKIYCSELVYISNEVNNQYRKRDHSMSSASNNAMVYKTVRSFFADWAITYLKKLPDHDALIDGILQDFKRKL